MCGPLITAPPDMMAATFWDDATTEIFCTGNGTHELLAAITGADAIGAAVATGMKPHPPLGWSHHTTLNPIVTVDGDTAMAERPHPGHRQRRCSHRVRPVGAVGRRGFGDHQGNSRGRLNDVPGQVRRWEPDCDNAAVT
ncbi:nuclear transport factor 2 family protein [Rhodococcus sp. 14-2470-1a]|uniref:nuclear transport factor 2 family protein n=1 Tax=Rhodococcus sp. 14-2470-1a TaxID=2023150 RepID=UPI0015C65A4E|nr:nuclear transport factor 2 family protein [Rhodococcus sp. 14-2470-1a]